MKTVDVKVERSFEVPELPEELRVAGSDLYERVAVTDVDDDALRIIGDAAVDLWLEKARERREKVVKEHKASE